VSDARFFGIIALLAVSLLAVGFIVGWLANPDDGHD
jgi:hypothetical protein